MSNRYDKFHFIRTENLLCYKARRRIANISVLSLLIETEMWVLDLIIRSIIYWLVIN